jgi:flagellar basal body-associated protein FliL
MRKELPIWLVVVIIVVAIVIVGAIFLEGSKTSCQKSRKHLRWSGKWVKRCGRAFELKEPTREVWQQDRPITLRSQKGHTRSIVAVRKGDVQRKVEGDQL